MKKCCFISLILLVLFSCNEEKVFEEYKKIEDQIWNSDSILYFNYLITDTISEYEINLKIRHNVDYEFSNLYVFLEQDNVKDTLEIVLAEKDGKWKGKGIGKMRELEKVIEQNKTYNSKNHYTITVEHAMRYGKEEKITSLKNISFLGVTIKKQHAKD